MAEHEVTKHTVKAVKVLNNKEKSAWGKVKEILLEIITIVFAITFSLWMHNRSEENHKQENVKQFLLGVKKDMQNDLDEMAEDTSGITDRLNFVTHLLGIYMGNAAYNQDTVNTSLNTLFFQGTFLIPNNGRFEGFKSSGQIGYIKNKSLADLIVDHYQENMVSLLWVSQIQSDFIKNQFIPYAVAHFKFNKKLVIGDAEQTIKDPQFNGLLLFYGNNAGAMLQRYRKLIKSSRDIIAAIDKEDL